MKKWLIPLLVLFSSATWANSILLSSPKIEAKSIAMSDLQSLPSETVVTALPWIEQRSAFTGVRLSDLVNHAFGELPDSVTLIGLNNYSATITRSDILEYQPLVAYLRDGKTMRIRHKGPYWVIYSLDAFPELDRDRYHSQMVWQLKEIIAEYE